ncbi:MAG TPA: phosphopantetheine-binding protein [Streptosporangiaceae bacterium]|nr:phosphopantetheine-binding protein [Streptosporangiaceae bacterium]
MNTQEAAQAIEEVLGQVAPDADMASLAADEDLRDTLELDSLDFLSFVEGLSKRVGQRIDEDDYPKLATMASASAFIAGRS